MCVKYEFHFTEVISINVQKLRKTCKYTVLKPKHEFVMFAYTCLQKLRKTYGRKVKKLQEVKSIKNLQNVN